MIRKGVSVVICDQKVCAHSGIAGTHHGLVALNHLLQTRQQKIQDRGGLVQRDILETSEVLVRLAEPLCVGQ